MTEIEIRGKLSKEKFNQLFKLLETDGETIDHYHLLSLIRTLWPLSLFITGYFIEKI